MSRKVTLIFRVTPEMKEHLEKMAMLEDRSISSYVRKLIRIKIEEENNKLLHATTNK